MHDKIDVGDVQSASCDIGGDKNQCLAITEALQCALTCCLSDIAVKGLQGK